MTYLGGPRRKHVIVSFVVTGLALIALVVGVSQARAAASDCPSANWCVWQDVNYGGFIIEFNNNNCGYDTCTNRWFATQLSGYSGVSAMKNNRANVVYFAYKEVNGVPPSSAKDCQNPGGARGNLLNYWYPDGTNENDEVAYYNLSYSNPSC